MNNQSPGRAGKRAVAKSGPRALPPVDRIERWPIGRLVPYAKNPRLHSTEQVDQIAASMAQFGQTQLVVVDPTGEVIAGHGRILAAQRLGIEKLVVGVAVGWSDAQKRAYRIADNQLTLNSEWDVELLHAEVQELQGVDFNMALLGFGEDLEELPGDMEQPEPQEEAIHERPKKPAVRRGDLWILGEHRLLCGDATNPADVETSLGGAEPKLMVTDPPYGVNYDPAWRSRAGVNLNKKKLGKVQNDSRADWSDAWALFDGDVAYVWHGGLHSGTVEESLAKNKFQIVGQIIWVKDRFALSRGDYHWQHEPCWYAVRAGKKHRWNGDRSQSTTWAIPAREDDGFGHGTQKPVECMRRPIENNSKRGEWIYEPFNGSGTTIIACHVTGRRCCAIELDPGYVQVAIERWENLSGLKATLDGKTLLQVAQARRTGRPKGKGAADGPPPSSNRAGGPQPQESR